MIKDVSVINSSSYQGSYSQPPSQAGSSYNSGYGSNYGYSSGGQGYENDGGYGLVSFNIVFDSLS